MDNDCAGELVCENDACVEPVLPPAPPAPAGAAAAATAPRAAPPPRAIPSIASEQSPSELDDEPRKQRPLKGKRHSTGMMVGGIVMTSFAPIALLVGAAGMISGQPEYFLGGFAATGVLCGVGIPLIVIGGKRERITTGYAAPWVTPESAGLQLRFQL